VGGLTGENSQQNLTKGVGGLTEQKETRLQKHRKLWDNWDLKKNFCQQETKITHSFR